MTTGPNAAMPPGEAGTCVVTGAFGYSGRYITRRLLKEGCTVRALTNAPASQSPFGSKVPAFPLAFDRPARLVAALRGADVMFNTYWVRFNHRCFTQADAVANTLSLFQAAREAGVRRLVHLSITNPSEDSPLEYFRGKARLERALRESGLSYAILRPTVLFGREDVLINNIAWLLRRFPFFGVFGDGSYRLQPIYVDDLAKSAVEAAWSHEPLVVDAIGPETFTYRELVTTIAGIIGKPRPIVTVPPSLGHLAGVLIGRVVVDVVITRAEIEGLMAGLLCTDSPPLGTAKLTEWAQENRETLGLHYASELRRRAGRGTILAPAQSASRT